MWKFQACLRRSVIPLFVIAGFIIVFTAGSCGNGKCSATYTFAIGNNMFDGYALLGRVFENVSVAGVIDCYQTCQPNCRCISFNFLTTVNKDNCQLNSENRHLKPGALVRMEGSHYYDLIMKYNIKSQSPCTQCINRCCSNPQPCLNGGTCRENCDENGKRFFCDCPVGFIGQLCENECVQALGMESGAISDGQITASSQFDAKYNPFHGRLHFQATLQAAGCWTADTRDGNQWLQVDLTQYTKVTRVATQGRNGHNQWVKEYKLQYSNDTVIFQYYREQWQNTDRVFTGNTDRDTVVSHDLNPPITARYIRFRPTAWYSHISMRVELYSCHGI